MSGPFLAVELSVFCADKQGKLGAIRWQTQNEEYTKLWSGILFSAAAPRSNSAGRHDSILALVFLLDVGFCASQPLQSVVFKV